jgi:hypothetical protein
MRIPSFTIYAKESGVEISPTEKKQQGKPDEGRVALRFFRKTSGAHQIRFIVQSWEAFELGLKIQAVQQTVGKETLTHKYDAGEGETVTKLTVECYQRNDKKGYAFSVQRGEENINVAVPLGEFLFAAEFLRHLSLQQCWTEERSKEHHHGGAS